VNHFKIGIVFGLVWLIGTADSVCAQTALGQEENSVRILSPLAKAFLDSNHVAVVRKHSNESIEIKESLKGSMKETEFLRSQLRDFPNGSQVLVFDRPHEEQNVLDPIIEATDASIVDYIRDLEKGTVDQPERLFQTFFRNINHSNWDIKNDAVGALTNASVNDLMHFARTLDPDAVALTTWEAALGSDSDSVRISALIMGSSRLPSKYKCDALQAFSTLATTGDYRAIQDAYDGVLVAILHCDPVPGREKLEEALVAESAGLLLRIRAVRAANYALNHKLIHSREFFEFIDSRFDRMDDILPEILHLAMLHRHEMPVQKVAGAVLTAYNPPRPKSVDQIASDKFRARGGAASYANLAASAEWTSEFLRLVRETNPEAARDVTRVIKLRENLTEFSSAYIGDDLPRGTHSFASCIPGREPKGQE
jgi:hypothetical protein